MAQNEGPFSKGERLTAVKLNDLATGRPISVTGDGVGNRSGGRDSIEIHKSEVIYIRLTEKDVGKTPIRYGWKEVDRLGNPTSTVNATWGNMANRTAKMTTDYAIELNNQNLSVSDNYIYRAERSPSTGEWLFFLRRKQGTPIVLSLSIGTKASGCEPVPILVKDGMRAWGASAPTWYRIKSSTLRWKDYNGTWTTLQTWDSLTETEPSSYTFSAPYVPTSTQPITFEYSAITTDGTILGQEEPLCNPIGTCLGDVYPGAFSPGVGSVPGLFGCMTSGCVAGTAIITSPQGYPVPLQALMTATGHATNNPTSIPVPAFYTGTTSFPAPGGDAALFADPKTVPGMAAVQGIKYWIYIYLRPPKLAPAVNYGIDLTIVRMESSSTQGVWPDQGLFYTPKCVQDAVKGAVVPDSVFGGNIIIVANFNDFSGYISYVTRTVTNGSASQTYVPGATC
jgi:hypothetical protein